MKRDVEEPADEFRIEDRRHWTRGDDVPEPAEEEPRPAGAVDELRRRAEDAESKLQEYIAAFKQREREQDDFRARLTADVERRVDLRFGDVLAELLETIDELDLALAHGAGVEAARPLVEGVSMVRDRFLTTLERNGVESIEPQGEPFDPQVAEALRIDPVDDPARGGTVTEVLQRGFRLGDRVIRPARVAVGRHAENEPG